MIHSNEGCQVKLVATVDAQFTSPTEIDEFDIHEHLLRLNWCLRANSDLDVHLSTTFVHIMTLSWNIFSPECHQRIKAPISICTHEIKIHQFLWGIVINMLELSTGVHGKYLYPQFIVPWNKTKWFLCSVNFWHIVVILGWLHNKSFGAVICEFFVHLLAMFQYINLWWTNFESQMS